MTRTYEDALSRLAALQSNRAITSLFAPPPVVPGSGLAQGANKAKDLNAVAIPEVIAWLGRAGLSQDDLSELKCIHVAGTKGKGSVCAFLTSILTQPLFRPVAGRVGTYTSPHLVTVRERIMLDGEPICQELFAKYFFEVWDAMTTSARAEYLRQHGDAALSGEMEAELQGPATKPFYFRFLTIMALHVFLKEGVKSAVIECGIGGEYDSTNILPPSAVTASVVTQLGIDHVGMLGGTLPEIAWHKIGIAKAGRKCFTRKLKGEAGEEAMRVMRTRAGEKGADLIELDDLAVEEWGGIKSNDARSLDGQFQKYNQALARAAIPGHLRLCEPGSAYASIREDLEDGIRSGLAQAQLRGRCETREEGTVTWLIDGAHTAESLEEVSKWFNSKLDSYAGAHKVLIFNQQERDAGRLLEVLCAGISSDSTTGFGPFNKAIFTRNDLRPRTSEEAERDLSVQHSASDAFKKIYNGSQPVICDNVADAVKEARTYELASSGNILVLVTGSLHLIGALLQTLEPEAPK
jgi:folylpolyglutamate synthase